MKRIDLVGRKFGLWTVIEFAGHKKEKSWWLCKCECGVIREVSAQGLRNGLTSSCGCNKGKAIALARTKHGQAKRTREYSAWQAMKKRVISNEPQTWPYYKRLGITVCDRWKDSFENFFADMGICPKGWALDRIDPYGNYAPENCRWADWHTQRMNQRHMK